MFIVECKLCFKKCLSFFLITLLFNSKLDMFIQYSDPGILMFINVTFQGLSIINYLNNLQNETSAKTAQPLKIL